MPHLTTQQEPRMTMEQYFNQLQQQNSPEMQLRNAEALQHVRTGQEGEQFAQSMGFPSLPAFQIGETVAERLANERLRAELYGVREQRMQEQMKNDPHQFTQQFFQQPQGLPTQGGLNQQALDAARSRLLNQGQ